MPQDPARAGFNAALRGRLTADRTPGLHDRLSGRQADSTPPTVPEVVEQATGALRTALASGDAAAIVAADDKLAAALDTASTPAADATPTASAAAGSISTPPRAVNWGQGARGTRAKGPTGSAAMSARLRAAARAVHGPAHASPGPDGRIR